MYSLNYDKRIVKDLRRVPKHLRDHILEKTAQLSANPRGPQVEKLVGMDGYRLRIGDYRALFTIDDRIKAVTVYRILHRREVYRQKRPS